MNKLQSLREALNMNRNQFAKYLEVHNSVISNYENGLYKPGIKFIKRLKSKIPNLNEAWFFNDEAEMFNSPQVPSFGYAQDLLRTIRIYTNVAAGEPMVNWETEEYELPFYHPALEKIKSQLFGFTVKGDSMEPKVEENDIVITRRLKPPDEYPHDGDYIVSIFHEGREANLKIFNWADRKKGEFILSSLNKKYPPMFHSLKETRYMFKVIFFISINI